MENCGKKKAGYEYLLAYKLSVPVYDLTVKFCDKWIGKRSRTYEQMVQAARSGMQNILEGNQQEGMKGYIKLSDNPEKAANMMITLVNQANYLIDKLTASLKEKHTREGGLTEELYRKRVEYRKKQRGW